MRTHIYHWGRESKYLSHIKEEGKVILCIAESVMLEGGETQGIPFLLYEAATSTVCMYSMHVNDVIASFFFTRWSLKDGILFI